MFRDTKGTWSYWDKGGIDAPENKTIASCSNLLLPVAEKQDEINKKMDKNIRFLCKILFLYKWQELQRVFMTCRCICKGNKDL